MRSTCFAVFHTNLAFSAIPESARATVIQRCYAPMLDLVEQGIPLGIECSGWTLRQIQKHAPEWITRFANLLQQQRCQLVGSGYVQLIGPLVPHFVNRWNQELGMQVYRELLDHQPTIAMVNEMAFSASLVPIYVEAGYEGLLLSRENALAGTLPTHGPWVLEGGGHRLPALFGDAILFQKFQRLIHGDIEESEYWTYLNTWDHLDQARPIYCSDAEIFDYRPKRYHYESDSNQGEWPKISQLFLQLKERFDFIGPRQALQTGGKGKPLRLTGCDHPITVKKQPKYNLARWAVSGKDDLLLNTLCHRLAQRTLADPTPAAREQVCRLFASDLRTHIHLPRLEAAMEELTDTLGVAQQAPLPDAPELPQFRIEEKGIYLHIHTENMQVCFNQRRGLAIHTLVFGKDTPLVGTLPHGYFHEISLGADFYSGTTVVECPGTRLRVTDLERVKPEIAYTKDTLVVRANLETRLGTLVKTWTLSANEPRLGLSYAFPNWERPPGTLRVGHITLLPEAWNEPISYTCHNGGPDPESFELNQPVNHHRAVSSLISCTTGLGATSGSLVISDGQRKLCLSWDPAQCAAFPMIWHQPCAPDHLTRIVFSLAEIDDTRGDGGNLMPFQVYLTPGDV